MTTLPPPSTTRATPHRPSPYISTHSTVQAHSAQHPTRPSIVSSHLPPPVVQSRPVSPSLSQPSSGAVSPVSYGSERAREKAARLRVAALDGLGRRLEEKEGYGEDGDDKNDKYHKPQQPSPPPQSAHSSLRISSPRSTTFRRAGPLAAYSTTSSAARPPAAPRSTLRPVCIVILMLIAVVVTLGAWLCFFLQVPLKEMHPQQLLRSHFQSPSFLSSRLPPSRTQPARANPSTRPSTTTQLAPSPQQQQSSSDSQASSGQPHYTAANLTFFTVYQPESPLYSRVTSQNREKLLAIDHRPFTHHLYALSRLVPHPRQLVVYVRSVAQCRELEALEVDHVCRVTSCFKQVAGGAAGGGDSGEDGWYAGVRCLVSDAREKAATPLLAFVDDHTLLFNDFLGALFQLAARLPSFVLAGSSVSLGTKREGIAAKTWHDDVSSSLAELMLKAAASSDRQQPHYFAFHRSLPLQSLNSTLLMGRSGLSEHAWERHLLAHLLLDDRVPVVDGSRAITAGDMRHADSSGRPLDINEWNDAQQGSAVNLTTAIGVLSNSHYVLAGRCPTCALKENHETDFALLLHRQGGADQQIILISVNSEYLPLAFNWLCRARALHISNYILLAEDRLSFRVLRQLSLPAVLTPEAPYRQPSPSTSTVAHHRRLYLRALYMHRAAELGYHVVSTSLNALLFNPPFPSLAPASQCDAHVYYHDRRVSTTMLSVPATPAGRRFLLELLSCETDNYNFTATHGQNRFYYSDEADNNCGHFVLKRLVKRNGLRRCELNGQQWIEQNDFLDATNAQRAGVWPVMVHSDGSAEEVESWARAWGGWKVDDQAMMDAVMGGARSMRLQCRIVSPPVFASPRFDDRHSFRLSVHILASSDPTALSATFDSLAAAVYDPSIPIDLHITVQEPRHPSLSTTQQLVESGRASEAFEWPHGDKTVRWSEDHVGETMGWMAGWGGAGAEGAGGEEVEGGEGGEDGEGGETDEAFHLGLRAGQAVSMQWFVWLKAALEAYYFNPFQFDSQLMGIHLQHQFTIVGETPAARFGSRLPSSALNGTLLYNYQYVPLAGTVFFPNHLASFYRWYAAQPHNNRTACLPTLISNQWLAADPLTHWQLHLTRFAFERGWYALHTNFAALADKRPRALLVDRQDGSGRAVQVVHRLRGPGEQVMVGLEAVPLYDVHFQRVDNKTLLHLRKEVFPVEWPPMTSTGTDDGKRQSGNITQLLVNALRIHMSSMADDLFTPSPTTPPTIDPEGLSLSSELTTQLSLAPPALPAATVYDRCFALDDDDVTAPVSSAASAAPIDVSAALPYPYNMSLTVEELYAAVYEGVVRALPTTRGGLVKEAWTPLFLVYRPKLLLPFDRHLRGLYFAFLAALLTGRVLLVDWPDLESMYDCPFADMKWSYSAFSPYFLHQPAKTATATAILDFHEEMEQRRLVDELRTRSLRDIYRRTVLVYSEPVSYDRLLFTNVDYKPYALSMFGTASRMRRTGLLMKLLLSRPKGAMVQQAKAVQHRMRLGASKYSVCVHLVAGDRRRVTGEDSALPLVAEHWSCVKSQLHHLGFGPSDVRLVLTSDSTDEYSVSVADSQLSQYGTVVVNRDVFANNSQYGVGNATVRASQQRDTLTNALQYDPYLLGLYQLGECDVSISSGTTFGIFGAARSGFSKRAYIYKPQPAPVKGKDGKTAASDEKDYCGPMHRIDMPKENDINF